MAASFKNKRIVVMGLGRFGGGVGVTRFLVQQGANVLVTDQSPEASLQSSVQALSDLNVEFRLSEHVIEDFTQADLIIVNPAVKPLGNPYLEAATDAGVMMTSEIRLLVERLPRRDRIIGVTGSAGKSTVTAMLGHIFTEAGEQSCFVGGNIGGSLLNELDRIGDDDWIVLELSSFMLESLRVDEWSPHIAIVTNLSPNHLDWHGSLDAYFDAKRGILQFQLADDIAVLGQSVQSVNEHFTTVGRCITVDEPETGNAIDMLIPGEHNQRNAALAIAAASVAGVSRDAAGAALATFAGLPHRLQFVCERGGVRYINDSKSTTPEAAMLAMASYPAGVVHVILGGADKGADLTDMAAKAKRHTKAIYTIGQTGDAVADAAMEAQGSAEVIRCGTLDRAVEATVSRVADGDVVLLSPGCASWGQFTNFEQRGERFVEAVLNCTGEGAAAPRGATARTT